MSTSSPQERNAVWSKLFPLALDASDPLAIREAAAWAGRHMRETAVNNLVARAVPEAPSVRRAMARALAVIAREPLPDYFNSRLQEDVAKLASGLTLYPFANLTLTYGAQPAALEIVRRGLARPEHDIRRSALFQLAAVGDLGPAVAVLGSDERSEDRAAAAEALGYYWTGDDDVRAALAAALDDPDPAVARAAKVARRRLKLSGAPKPPAKPPLPAVSGARHPWQDLLRRWSWQLLQVEAFAVEQDDAVVESGWLGLPGAEVRPFVEDERELVDIWTNEDPAGDWGPLRTAIQVSDVGDAAVYLLCPDAAGSDGEWEAWLFANWIPGAHRYASWWELLQAEHRSFLEVEKPPEPPG